MAASDRIRRSWAGAGVSDSVVGLLVFVASFAYFQGTLRLTLDLRDEGYLLYQIARTASGEIPHRDFLEVYGPGVYALTAPVFSLFGDRVLPVRELIAVFRAAAVAFSYLIARHFAPRSFALLGAFFAAACWGRSVWNLNAPYAALFTIPICELALLLLLAAEARRSRGMLICSGFVCGVALLFKWPLAAMSAYGMGAALVAGAMLEESPRTGARGLRRSFLIAWGATGLTILIPFVGTMGVLDYLLHFAPIHALFVVVAVRFARVGDGRAALATAVPRVAAYAAGLVIAPLVVAALYLSWNSLAELLHDVVYRPLRCRNYYLPVGLPSADALVWIACVASLASCGLALIRGSRRSALAGGAIGLLLAPFVYQTVIRDGRLLLAPQDLTLQLPCITAFAALAIIGAGVIRGRSPELGRSWQALIAALLFQEMMAFQIFPRAGYNVMLMSGTLAPMVAFVSHQWYRTGIPANARSGRVQRAAAFLLVASLPVLFTAQLVRSAVFRSDSRSPEARVLGSPRLAGIHPGPETWKRQRLGDFDALAAHLAQMEPPDAPLFVMQNEPMLYFVSARPPLFADHAMVLFLAGWDMLPENDRATPPASALIGRLAASPDAILVHRVNDPSIANLVKTFPQLARYIARHYRVVFEVGDYRILRKAGPNDTGGS